MNAILIPALAAIISAIIGVILANWYKRSKPWIGISSIDRDDSTFIDIDSDIIQLYIQSIYYNSDPLKSSEPLYKIRNEINMVEGSLSTFKETVTEINKFLIKLDNGISSNFEKRQALSELFSNNLFLNVLSFLNDTNQLTITGQFEPVEDDNTVIKIETFNDQSSNSQGIVMYGDKSRHYISIGGIITEQAIKRTEKLGKVFSNFHINEIRNVLNLVKNTLSNEIQISLDIKDRLDKLIQSRRLLVKVKVSNIGGSPLQFEPHGILNIKKSGKEIKPIIIEAVNYRTHEPGTEELAKMMQIIEGMAEKQGVSSSYSPEAYRKSPEYIVVNPGAIVEIDLDTISQFDDPQIIAALETGLLSSQVILVQANKKRNKYVKSDFQSMGLTISQDKLNELMKIRI